MESDKIKAVKNFLIGVVVFFVLLFSIVFMFSKATPNQVVGQTANDTSINSEQAMKEFVKGRWSATKSFDGMVVYCRFEITDNQIQYWTKNNVIEWDSKNSEWATEPEETLAYSIGPLEMESDTSKKRILGETELGTLLIRYYDNGESSLKCVTISGEEYDLQKGWKY